MTISNNSVIKGKGKDDFEEIRTLKHKMTNKFNVGDRVKFTSEWRKYLNRYGCIKAVSTGRYYIDGCIKDGYFVEWDGGEHSWISENKLSLVTPESTTVQETKELKAEIESEIIRLIQDFNKRPTLKFKTLILITTGL